MSAMLRRRFPRLGLGPLLGVAPDPAPFGPEATEWQTVWLGTDQTANADGWYPVQGPVRRQQLAIFPPRVTIGDSSKDSDTYISSWISGDWTGGVGVLTLNEGSDDQRDYDEDFIDTRSPNQTALGPLVRSYSPVGSACYPLGMVVDASSGHATYFVAAVGTTLYYFTGSNWLTTGITIAGAPTAKGVTYQGLGTTPQLFIPMGSAGYEKISVTGTSFTKTHGGDITPKEFCLYDGKIMAFNGDGKLYASVDESTTFTKLLDATGDDKLILDPAYQFRHLVSYFDTTGDPALYAITDRAAWIWNDVVSKWQITTFQYPPHPHFGLGVAVFRSGENLWVSAGLDILNYGYNKVESPLSGLSRDNGVPADSRGFVKDLQAEQSCLYALTSPDATSGATKCRLYAWTGVGWHGMWSANETPTWMGISSSDPAGDGSGYCLHWGTSSRIYTMKLRLNFINPREDFLAQTGWFAESGYVESGRFDANMRGFFKLASHCIVFCDSAASTETITIQYRTDAAPDAYVTLGTVNASGKSVLPFDLDEDGFVEGLQFNWIQFRLTFARGADITKTPLLEAFILHYTKIPQDATSFELTVPLPPEQWNGRSGQEMADALDDLLVVGSFVNFVHQNRSFRCLVASVGGTDNTGDDYSGGRTLNLIEIRVPDAD
jgi:hypothetical protein